MSLSREPLSSSERRAELGWAAFCVACAGGMLILPQWQTVPFHWIWITITLLYGYRRWSNLRTAVVLLAVIVITTITMLRTPVERAELSEIPLMSCVFLAMVWHVRRRQDAVDEQRRIAQREREFMRDAAHSLRTPLTVAHGHAELLRDALEPGSQTRDDAVVMLDELRRLAGISDKLLLLSAAGHADALLLAPVRLDVLVRDAGRRWSAASRREITVDDSEPVCVLGDEQRLRHSLDALVENALNATGPGDRVTVRAGVRDGWAELAVTDTGCGIAAADVDHMFERFVRGPCAGDRPGTGLGLPIVKAITEAHGGTVTVTSRPARGSTFRLRIGPARAPCPTATASDSGEMRLSPGRRESSAGGRPR
jgi:two-component system, OmpR family, sensor kinase